MNTKKKEKKPSRPRVHWDVKKEAGIIFFGINDVGEIFAEIENSFSMGFSHTNVRLYRKKPQFDRRTNKYFQKQLTNLRKKYPYCIWFMFRANSKYCPLKLDWKWYHQLRKERRLDKFNSRNLKFNVDEVSMQCLLDRHFLGKQISNSHH